MQLVKVTNHVRFADLNFTFYTDKVTIILNIFLNKILLTIDY